MRWVAAICLLLAGLSAANAQCAVPNTLTNGQTADATQVMANFNAVLGCVNGPTAGIQLSGSGGGIITMQNPSATLGRDWRGDRIRCCRECSRHDTVPSGPRCRTEQYRDNRLILGDRGNG